MLMYVMIQYVLYKICQINMGNVSMKQQRNLIHRVFVSEDYSFYVNKIEFFCA